MVENRRAGTHKLTYAKFGVNRIAREKSREEITSGIVRDSYKYRFGKPTRLPFGLLYPSSFTGSQFFDLQIEGAGTKTLLAELTGKYDTIGIDAVAMAVNDVIRSGSSPLIISDAIHIGSSNREIVSNLIRGVRAGAKLSSCIIASGETGSVTELLHPKIKDSSPPFDLMVSCLGIVRKQDVISGTLTVGDSIIGLRSSGIHSNGLTLARKVLLKPWGGAYDPWFRPPALRRSVVEELLEPTAIYAVALGEVQKSAKIKAAVHITGDGFAKFRRLLIWQRKFKQSSAEIGLKFEGLRRMPPIFRLIYDAARSRGNPIALAEMFRTFNMGYGFAIAVGREETEVALSSLRKHVAAEKIGTVSNNGRICISSFDTDRTLVM